MLKYISDQTVARGMNFQLGIWMHGYVWNDSPSPNYSIAGLTPELHGPYCRDAVAMRQHGCGHGFRFAKRTAVASNSAFSVAAMTRSELGEQAGLLTS